MKSFRIQFYIILLMLGLFFVRCTWRTNNLVEQEDAISGRYINQTSVEESSDGLIAENQAYCYEMNFISADSVVVDYGFEQGRLAYKKQNDSYLLIGASQGADLAFTLSQDSSITLLDTEWLKLNDRWVGRSHPLRFQKSKNPKTDHWSFENWLNARLVVGDYTLYDQNGFSKGKTPNKAIVKLNADGSISDFYAFTAYSLCYSGDCLSETKTPANLITLKTSEGKEQVYIFDVDKSAHQLTLYSIGPMAKDKNGNLLKGERIIGAKAFVLVKLLKSHAAN